MTIEIYGKGDKKSAVTIKNAVKVTAEIITDKETNKTIFSYTYQTNKGAVCHGKLEIPAEDIVIKQG